MFRNPICNAFGREGIEEGLGRGELEGGSQARGEIQGWEETEEELQRLDSEVAVRIRRELRIARKEGQVESKEEWDELRPERAQLTHLEAQLRSQALVACGPAQKPQDIDEVHLGTL